MKRKTWIGCILLLLVKILFFTGTAWALNRTIPVPQIDTAAYVTYTGTVTDQKTESPLAFATVMLDGTNISTISNTEGAFVLKVPRNLLNGKLVFSFLGYKAKTVLISALLNGTCDVELESLPMVLPEVSVLFSDASSLVKAVIRNKGENYVDKPSGVTAFYRETIKRRKTYVSLLEAVVDVCKYPYTSEKQDWAALYKVRKNTDYHKLDTLVFKLMGGPYNTLFADMMKNSDEFFDPEIMGDYSFSFDGTIHSDDKLLYVVSFEQLPAYTLPLYFGKLYIDADKLALVSAEFGINLKNREEASLIFIKKKPVNASAYPTRYLCRVDYTQRNGKWFLNYSRVELDVYINWKKKWFNTTYSSTMEMAVTDWKPVKNEGEVAASIDRMKVSTIVADKATGFADPDFWGEYNVIEPEKSIQSAIRKIQKQLKKK